MLFLLPILCALVSEDWVWDKEDTIPSSCHLITLRVSIIPTIVSIPGACIKFNLFSVAVRERGVGAVSIILIKHSWQAIESHVCLLLSDYYYYIVTTPTCGESLV